MNSKKHEIRAFVPSVHIKGYRGHIKYGVLAEVGPEGYQSLQTPCVGYHFNVVLMTELIADNFKAINIISRPLKYKFQYSRSYGRMLNILRVELEVLILVKHLQETDFYFV